MPALDPMSASSRPMYDFDSQNRQPLGFAETLQPLDPNSLSSGLASSSKPVRVKQYDEPLPKEYPAPKYDHSRRPSDASIALDMEALDLGEIMKASPKIWSDEWMQLRVQRCIDNAEGKLELNNLGLESLSTRISDLRHLVTISSTRSPSVPSSNLRARYPPSPSVSPIPPHLPQSPGRDHFSADARSFTRTVSAPASSAVFGQLAGPGRPSVRQPMTRVASNLRPALQDSPMIAEVGEVSEGHETDTDASSPALLPAPQLGARAPMGRSRTGAVGHMAARQVSGSARNTEAELYLSNNLLTSLPSALFEITNLTALSLRGNRLTTLPAAIGNLRNLKELTISNNKITYLPSTILDLKLEQFSAHPNEFLPRPQIAPLPFEIASPASRIQESDSYNDSHGRILSVLVRHQTSPILSLFSICANILISPRPVLPLFEYDHFEAAHGLPHPLLSAKTMAKHLPQFRVADISRILQTARSNHAHQTEQGRVSGKDSEKKFPMPNTPLPPDDAALNPFYSPCPCTRHGNGHDQVIRRLYLHPAEERIEWLTVAGSAGLPVKWYGCKPGCLAFLERDDNEEDEEGDGFNPLVVFG